MSSSIFLVESKDTILKCRLLECKFSVLVHVFLTFPTSGLDNSCKLSEDDSPKCQALFCWKEVKIINVF